MSATYVDQDLGICAPNFSSVCMLTSDAIAAADREAARTALTALIALRAINRRLLDERVAALLVNEVRWLVEHSAWGMTEHGTDAGDRLCDVVLLLENASDAAIRSQA